MQSNGTIHQSLSLLSEQLQIGLLSANSQFDFWVPKLID